MPGEGAIPPPGQVAHARGSLRRRRPTCFRGIVRPSMAGRTAGLSQQEGDPLPPGVARSAGSLDRATISPPSRPTRLSLHTRVSGLE